MEKKRPILLTIFGWLETIVGAIGTLLLITSIILFVIAAKESAQFGAANLFGFSVIFSPSILFLVAGIALLRRRYKWAIIFNGLLLILASLLILYVL